VAADDELRIEVTLDRIGKRSIQVQYDAFIAGGRVAAARSRYVCVPAASGEPALLPRLVR
jgi:acyl-CoA thioesterase FadM